MPLHFEPEPNRRILIVDDNPAIHDDFRKVLVSVPETPVLDAIEASLFGGEAGPAPDAGFELVSAHQGQEGVDRAREALANGRPFAMAFVDIRMPPGFDGVETALRLWEVDPQLQIVICSAYSDYSWDDMRKKLGVRQQLLILKKPFDPVEVLQLAHALTEKWALLLASRRTVVQLEAAVSSRTQALETTHQKLLHEIDLREATEAHLRHEQNLASLGRLAGGIAHEINNPLSFVISNLNFITEVVTELQAAAPISSDLNKAAADALSGAERIRRIVRDVKVFSQAEAAPLARVDLPNAVRRALQQAASAIDGRASVTVNLGRFAEVWASEEGLVQVLFNLLANAAQALPDGHAATNRIVVTAEADAQGRVAIDVRDNGMGILPEHLHRIFDPFFTTKDVGSGTGLGLCICHGIVTKLGGELTVESVPGSGTRFRIALPPPVGVSISPVSPLADLRLPSAA